MADPSTEKISLSSERSSKIDTSVLKERHQQMTDLPFLQTREVTDNLTGEPQGQQEVLVPTIIAAPNLQSWVDEYHNDWKRDDLSSVESLATEMTKNKQSFWENRPAIKLTKINGPKGPIYAVEDGSHRVAAAKLAEVLEIPAEVSDLTDRKRLPLPNEEVSEWWGALIASGAIKAKIEKDDKQTNLVLEEIPEIPWIVRSRSNFIKINKVYRQVYGEEALQHIKSVPQEILYDQGKAMVWENKTLKQSGPDGI